MLHHVRLACLDYPIDQRVGLWRVPLFGEEVTQAGDIGLGALLVAAACPVGYTPVIVSFVGVLI